MKLGPFSTSPSSPSFPFSAGHEVCPWLARRKAHPAGHLVSRTCVCASSSPLLCGACALLAQRRQRVAEGAAPGDPLFPRFSARRLQPWLRETAAALGIPDATWHSLRRGFASDLMSSGEPLAHILVAGGWRSGAFLRYIVRADAERVLTCSG